MQVFGLLPPELDHHAIRKLAVPLRVKNCLVADARNPPGLVNVPIATRSTIKVVDGSTKVANGDTGPNQALNDGDRIRSGPGDAPISKQVDAVLVLSIPAVNRQCSTSAGP